MFSQRTRASLDDFGGGLLKFGTLPYMPEVTSLPPDLSRSVSAVARALVAATRAVSLYPREHPAVTAALQRLRASLEGFSGPVMMLGVTPDTLVVEEAALPAEDGPIAEAAALLHGHDILQIAFDVQAPVPTLQAFLDVLVVDSESLRQRGGPAAVWAETGLAGVRIEQVDYQKVFADRDVEKPATRKDELWLAIVRAVLDRRKSLEEAAQRRLLEIAGDVGAIGELAADVMAPNHTPEGSPMITSQAAAVLAAYRHLTGIVTVLAPERRDEVMRNVAAATANLDPRVVMQLLRTEDDPTLDGGSGGLVKGIAAAFDDLKVAQLLATTLAIDGQASERLAQVFDTIAPDETRKRRVLTLTRSLLSETDFGRTDQFRTLWSSMEELLISYNERPFVSAQYRAGLDNVGGRAEAMAVQDLPDELEEWVSTLRQENVQRLSVTLLIDLLNLERDPKRAPALARDIGGLAEDLVLAGDYGSAVQVVEALEGATRRDGVMREPARVAIDQLAVSPAMYEVVALLTDLGEAEYEKVRTFCRLMGAAATEPLQLALTTEARDRGQTRAADIIAEYGAPAVGRLAPLVANPNWYVQRNAAVMLGRLAAKEAVPLLQPLLRGSDARVTRAAVRALSNIDDPAAARAVHTVLRAATGDARKAVVAALVAAQDARVVPVLVRILDESDPLGRDHAIVLETLGALGQVGSEEAVPAIARLMQRRSWFAWKKIRAVKSSSLGALRTIGTPAAAAAVADAARNGDRLLRKLARSMPVGHA